MSYLIPIFDAAVVRLINRHRGIVSPFVSCVVAVEVILACDALVLPCAAYGIAWISSIDDSSVGTQVFLTGVEYTEQSIR